MILVLTNVQLRPIFEEHKLGSVWKHLPFSIKFNFSAFPMHLPHAPSYLYVSSYFFFLRTVSASCSVSTSYKFFLSDILLSVWLIFNTIFLNWKLVTIALLTWVVILLAASFDNIWNSMEHVINLDGIWRYLSKTFDIWVEDIWWYLTIIWRYLKTEMFTLELENYLPKDIVNFVIYCLVGTEL